MTKPFKDLRKEKYKGGPLSLLFYLKHPSTSTQGREFC